MAKRKEFTEKDAIALYNDIIDRCNIQSFIIDGDIIIGINNDDNLVFITPENKLLDYIVNRFKITDINDYDKYKDISLYTKYIELENDSPWVNLNIDELYSGDVYDIKIEYKDHEFISPIHKDCFPLRLRKAEFKDIRYAVIISDYILLLLQKLYSSPIEGYSFYITRIFKVI